MTNSELNQFLRRVLTIIMSLHVYPQSVIDAFCQAFITAAKKQPTGSPYLALGIALADVLNPYHDAIQITDIDRGTRGTDVKVIKSKKDYIINKLTILKGKVIGLTNNDENLIHEIKLDTISVYYSGVEKDIIKYWQELLKIVNQKPILVSLVPEVEILEKEITILYTTKTEDAEDISLDVSGKKTLIEPIKTQMRLCFFNTCILCNDDLSKVADFFKTDIIDGYTKGEGFLYVNEYMLKVLAGMFLCCPQVKYKLGDSFKLESSGKGDAMIFKSSIPNPTVVPTYAKLAKAGETIELKDSNLGADDQYYLIIAAVTPGEDVEIKLTVKSK